MSRAWQTPRGARPNRRGELARLAEGFRESESTPFTVAQAPGKDEPSGRLLDPGREAGARGMIVTEHCCKVVRRTESGLGSSPANYIICQYVSYRDCSVSLDRVPIFRSGRTRRSSRPSCYSVQCVSHVSSCWGVRVFRCLNRLWD